MKDSIFVRGLEIKLESFNWSLRMPLQEEACLIANGCEKLPFVLADRRASSPALGLKCEGLSRRFTC